MIPILCAISLLLNVILKQMDRELDRMKDTR